MPFVRYSEGRPSVRACTSCRSERWKSGYPSNPILRTKRSTVGPVTPAPSASCGRLSRPAVGYVASSARATRRSEGVISPSRSRTSSPIVSLVCVIAPVGA